MVRRKLNDRVEINQDLMGMKDIEYYQDENEGMEMDEHSFTSPSGNAVNLNF